MRKPTRHAEAAYSSILGRAPAMLEPVAEKFRRRLAKFGAEPRGVYWNDREGQLLRFEVLMGVVDLEGGGISVNDLGCGYGAFFDYLEDQPLLEGGRYFGYDICDDMVKTARQRISDPRAFLQHSLVATRDADYSFASGTYNLRMGTGEAAWMDFVKASLADQWAKSRKGMAFNMLSCYRRKREPALYYADPAPYFDFCMRVLSPQVTLLHDYPLVEWTIYVRR